MIELKSKNQFDEQRPDLIIEKNLLEHTTGELLEIISPSEVTDEEFMILINKILKDAPTINL